MTGHFAKQAGLLTDLYELRMVESYLRDGMTEDATFSLHIRPTRERPWFVALGVFRVLELIKSFRFGHEELEYLRSVGLREETLDYLESLSPSGEIWAVEDGTIVLADEPILEITAPLPFAQLIETAVINLVQYPTLVATKAARVALAAEGRATVEFGFRRSHGLETGVEAAVAAYIGAGMSTSNMEAGRRYGIDVVGTMAHSFVQSYPSELEAFRAFARDHAGSVTLLVDTYDTFDGVRNAIVVAGEMRVRGEELRAIRIDSGDLHTLAVEARKMLDDAGFPDVGIFASGGLDEYDIDELVHGSAPIDAFGVGTDLVTSADRPALDIAYKLVAYAGRPLAKFSTDKASLPGAKQIFRTRKPTSDVLALRDEQLGGHPLLSCVWRDGRASYSFDRERARATAQRELDGLPKAWRRPRRRSKPPRPPLSPRLEALVEAVRRATSGTT